tara:strand:- start:68 stop:352 length:285 start_codon:yes stop_codon:yes gene_type:complete
MSREFSFTWEREVDVMHDDQEGTYMQDCLVTCELSGPDIPAKLYPIDDAHPAERPELEVVSVVDQDGEEILACLEQGELDRIYATANDNGPDYD